MRSRHFLGTVLALLVPLGALAGQQLCGKQVVPSNLRTCPDGSIPLYVADEIKPYVPPQPAARPGRPEPAERAPAKAPAGLDYYFGVWRTNIPGAVWTSPSGYRGYDWLHVSAGAAAGDLIIKPDGSYVWNSYGGKSGRWVAGDAEYPIVLIDTSENRRWRVGRDARRTGGRDIIIWDGNSFHYNGRR